MSQHPLQSIWDAYTASWKTDSPAERDALFAQSLDRACTYNDPLATAQGWAQLTAYMDDFHRQVPGGHFVTHYFASHNQQSLAKWNMVNGSGQVIGEGVSYGRYNDDNRLVSMTGFFDTPRSTGPPVLHLQQLQEGIDYIEAHLESDIDLADVARAAGLSQWHFQRIFKALTNETLKTYIRSRRFANALEQLASTRLSVLDIALAAGYETQESFTRAFKDCFRLTPSQYRRMGNRSLFVRKVRLDESYLEHLRHNVSLAPTIEVRPTMRVVGLPTDYYGIDSEKNNLGQKLPPLWGQFLPRLNEIANAVPGVCYGVVLPAGPRTEQLRYLACTEVQGAGDLPAGMATMEIPASTYARFTHRGEARNVDATVNYIYGSWMVSGGRSHTLGPDLEIYDSRYHPTSAQSVMHYAVPVHASAG